MPAQMMQPVTDTGFGIEKAAANLSWKKMSLRRKLLALSSDLGYASAVIADRVDEIVNFSVALPENCGREERAARISAMLESLRPAERSLRSRRPLHPGLGELIANCIGVSPAPWILAVTITALLVLAGFIVK